MTGYEIYCAWCRDHNRPAPTREWWNAACMRAQPVPRLIGTDFDIETEQREGWGYDDAL